MGFEITDLAHLYAHDFDEVIDVRSPAEFAEDHVPGAINLPALNNEERAEVGTIYKQESRFKARKLGAALILRNVADHIETHLQNRPKTWRPLVYCWRGGQRSGTFAWLMREIGWQAETVVGGYRTYRRLVAARLHDHPLPWRFVLLQGMTCTGKTELLSELAALGTQVLDLEGAAHHRGSVFGGHVDPQPMQKMFESRLAVALSGCDPARPVVVEAESSKIGNLFVPPSIWQAMTTAPRVEITAPLAARAEYFLRAYADLVADPARFAGHLDQLIPLQGHQRVTAWRTLLTEGRVTDLAAGLMQTHYDPRYARALAHWDMPGATTLKLTRMCPSSLAKAAKRLSDMISQADAQGDAMRSGVRLSDQTALSPS